jgi:hypothetical protein
MVSVPVTPCRDAANSSIATFTEPAMTRAKATSTRVTDSSRRILMGSLLTP